ncbi:MAG: electron transfer flavoprotein subunit alpha/FixB family protein [Acholeplasmataceae bacterium]|nr:electron transfer flavoprotein subunit alpha/FixB family protein [Acholeplasmataceae bacterium]
MYAEIHAGTIHPVTYQLITKAKQIAGDKKVVVLLFTPKGYTLETLLQVYGPDEIIIVKNDHLKDAPDSLIADLIAQLNHQRKPNSILFGATVIGRSISARLQAKLLTGLTADCLDLSFEEDLLIQTKPSYGDNIMCEIVCPNHFPQMATVRPNIFVAEKEESKTVLLTEIKNLVFKANKKIVVHAEKPLLSKGDSIANASRVLAIGRGASDKKTLVLIDELAHKLGAKIGVTRPLTDLPQFSVEDQIGQSGNSIAPKLLINLGLHGAVQFTAGIEKAELVISVNKNEKAPIFDYSDYQFVGDAQAFVEAMLKVIQ